MITAVDSNVLIDVLGADPTFGLRSKAALSRCRAEGVLVACEIVWSEVIAAFPDVRATEAALARLSIDFTATGAPAAASAGTAWRAYRQAGGPRERLVPDFLVAAHAVHHADRLLTRDRGFHRRAFAELEILDPTA
ncbi:MAG TPA: type II toxin-antitoxin system VapC family toxin [Candidatus Limnocylindrales bacterium]|nr:type II toxin-antitoxin system VapC family toxin [Candidatus Limnocylindrales bacterium]